MKMSVGTRKAIHQRLEEDKRRIYGDQPGFAFQPFKGLMAATFTPLSEDSYSVDLSNIDAYAKDLVSQGVVGIFVNGTSGQSTSITVEERKQIVDAWIKTEPVVSGKLKIIVHVGCDSIVDILNLSKHASKYSSTIQGVAVMSPSYFKPQSATDVAELLARVAHTIPKIPVYYYHIPFMNGINVSVAETLMKARTLAPNVIGCKFTSTDFADLQRCTKNGFNCLVGADDMLSYALAAGVDGAIGITYNFVGKLHAAIIDAYMKGHHTEAHEMQKQSTELMYHIKASGNLNGACFYLFEKQRGISLGASRFPVYKLDDDLKLPLEKYVSDQKMNNSPFF
uniref:N-acetylneuraminate lyase n=1 Tax=Aplanochytrium stocchinoi TaxID=215587 RepID=A0A7S3LQX1_9STRA|mmetsp:Transcript_20407/g.24721  ORF Transcript_20407/g.24721 Transcript_20407/m.24721 type:complete len:338 (+) Transcript_20407:158-1171(+)